MRRSTLSLLIPGLLTRAGLLASGVLLASSLVGCPSEQGPIPTLPTDPDAASVESLEALHARIRSELDATDPRTDRYLRLRRELDRVAQTLAERGADAIRHEIEALPRTSDRPPLAPLHSLRRDPRLAEIEALDPDTQRRLLREIDARIADTERCIEDRRGTLTQTPEEDLLARLQLLAELGGLHGEGSREGDDFEARRAALLASIVQQAEDAIGREDYGRARELLAIAAAASPGDRATRERKCEVDAELITRQLAHTLETDRVDDAIDRLEAFAGTACFEHVRDRLAETAGPLSEDLARLGREATAAGSLSLAYRRYADARSIQVLLLDAEGEWPGIEGFLAQVEQAYRRAAEAGEYGLALGYLEVMAGFGSAAAELPRWLRATRQEIARRAVPGLTVYAFADPPSSTIGVGDVIAAGVLGHVVPALPKDVRVVEREQLERTLAECPRPDACSTSAAASFVVRGSILAAEVESTTEVGSETLRVVTGRETEPNEEHTRWSQRPERDRKEIPEPPRMVTRNVEEEVTIEVTKLRKVGVLAVTYQVLEVRSGRTVSTDSMRTKLEVEDEGRPSVQRGSFRREVDPIELPSDIEILSGSGGLADRISAAIGDQLVQLLADPEDRYEADARLLAQAGDPAGAARSLARAIVLRERKSGEIDALREDLMSYSMASPPR